jgi:hypothetical protein
MKTIETNYQIKLPINVMLNDKIKKKIIGRTKKLKNQKRFF